MAKYVASINIPGYLPEGDAPVFDTPGEAWAYLADERERDEEDTPGDEFSDTVRVLRVRAKASASDSIAYGEGVTYGATPGYDGAHDLGAAYSVTEVSDAEAAEIEASQG